MLNHDTLTQGGINVEEALERVMGNEDLLDRLLGMFLADTQYDNLQAAVEAHDEEKAIAAVHSLKGTYGNLSMTTLFELATQQLALLREGNWDDAVALMPQLSDAYRTARAAVEARNA